MTPRPRPPRHDQIALQNVILQIGAYNISASRVSPAKMCMAWAGPVRPRLYHFALPHLKTIRTPSLLDSRISKRSTLHFCTPSSQSDQHSITFTLPHLKTINTPSLLHSHISKRQHSITFTLPHLKTTNTPSLLRSHISERTALHHFDTPTSQNDQHSITFAFPHLKTSCLLCVGCEH